jgi:hypothetical protein
MERKARSADDTDSSRVRRRAVAAPPAAPLPLTAGLLPPLADVPVAASGSDGCARRREADVLLGAAALLCSSGGTLLGLSVRLSMSLAACWTPGMSLSATRKRQGQPCARVSRTRCTHRSVT